MAFTVIDGGQGKLPKLSVEIDFTNDPTNVTRVWTDVTSDVRDLAYVRAGRNHELTRSIPGTLEGVLNNRHGRYDPTNSASPFYPGVKRMRWVRARAEWAGVTYDRWRGLIEVWAQEWPGAGKDSIVHIQAADSMKVLQLFDLAGLAYSAQRTDQRVAAVCATIGIPSAVETGLSSVVAVPASGDGSFPEGSSAKGHLEQVEETENGLVYAEGDGTITFQNRHHRLLTNATSRGVIGDQAGEIRYRDGRLTLDDADVWNIAGVTADGATTPATWEDALSSTAHFKRRLSRSILTSSTTEALSAAQYLVGRYGDPSPRVPSLQLIGSLDPSKWPLILSAKNSDRFTWKRRATAHTISQDVFVERVADTITPGGNWIVSMELSPADDQVGWVLGDSVYGRLGETTVLVY